ncbi:phosphoribosylglycinamide formyltransferase [Chryseobacterium sp. MFBS3-17]|uniref:phosphoribosylglycinamide formyltransferase n=1 Tax=Chryseobacterium sp. MFBS3-17 TaxID=2886689 RepID=UPI001D0E1112|nr:phosphoribosylglycinamide formyltransferase [Chryseobacterium sp. MFBS3-17]MCC2589863.1 phosphoribosylglycinamide formyltransferase [Chryseobacterium sp. MFBS3-17]
MKKLVILVSGSGTNLQRIIDSTASGEIPDAEISLVVADRECYGLQRAEDHGIKNQLIRRGKGFSAALETLMPEDTSLIVLAGFLSILSTGFCEKYHGRIINIHPALLPKFGGKGMWGMNVHQAVIDAGEKESGATVHFVTAEIDEGEIILQGKVAVEENDTPETLAAKVHQAEYDIFPKAIAKVLRNQS